MQQFLEEIKAHGANEKQRHKTDAETLRAELAKAKPALQGPRWKGYPCERDGRPRCHAHHRVGYCQRELGLEDADSIARNGAQTAATADTQQTTSARRDNAPLLRAPARQGCCRGVKCPFLESLLADGCPAGLEWAWIFWGGITGRAHLPDCGSSPIELMLSSGLNQILALVGSSRQRSKLKVFLQMS